MKQLTLATVLFLTVGAGYASPNDAAPFHSAKLIQIWERSEGNDSTIFSGHLENKEYQVWLDINFIQKDILIPQQEVFGQVPGYLGAKRDSRKWIISDATITGDIALLTIINDYGSEDLTAKLIRNSDGSYTLEQLSGNVIRIVVNNKWLKLPKRLVFIKK